MYIIRGASFGKHISVLEIYNITFSIIADFIIYKLFGLKALIYLISSLWIGYSFHPAAAHFIQEHYTYTSGQETYSYYGSLNWIFLNVGYHNEHHDFPKVRKIFLKSLFIIFDFLFRFHGVNYLRLKAWLLNFMSL